MRIGLISDTHGFLDPKINEYLKDVDEIWHAGDIGNIEVLDELSQFKPTRAVYGNIDGTEIRTSTKEDLHFEIEGVKFLITHIAGPFEKYTPRVKKLIETHRPNVLICGHSHICKVAFDKKFNLIYINPGAAGNHGFHHIKTIIRFNIDKGKINQMEVVELGKRAISL